MKTRGTLRGRGLASRGLARGAGLTRGRGRGGGALLRGAKRETVITQKSSENQENLDPNELNIDGYGVVIFIFVQK